MSYIYIITKDNKILGATTVKYMLKAWKDDYKPSEIVIRRFEEDTEDTETTFTLEEYLANPNKQFKRKS